MLRLCSTLQRKSPTTASSGSMPAHCTHFGTQKMEKRAKKAGLNTFAERAEAAAELQGVRGGNGADYARARAAAQKPVITPVISMPQK
jgi:hypothetical protein